MLASHLKGQSLAQTSNVLDATPICCPYTRLNVCSEGQEKHGKSTADSGYYLVLAWHLPCHAFLATIAL